MIPIRGNVGTRLQKMETENLAGVVLAAAGIMRMDFGERITMYMEPREMIPAIGQGALAIETREDDPVTHSALAGLDHAQTADCVAVERAFLRRMGGGCQVPMAAYCSATNDSIKVIAAVVHPDGTPMISEEYVGPAGDASTGTHIADRLIARGADKILKEALGRDWVPGEATEA
jgi:hydroxymethylbilane synthase